MPEPRILLTDLILGESPRWHDDRLWFSDWGAQEVLAVDLESTREVIARVPSFPSGIDWAARRAAAHPLVERSAPPCVGSLTGRW